MACTYVYEGQSYDRAAIVTAIKQGRISAPLQKESARAWLREKLGMEDSEIEIVAGLIEGNVFGRFLEDGRILLSDQLEGVQYHEAFHRVWRTMLTPEDVQMMEAEFLARQGAQKILERKAKLYPEATRAELIEEVLAEEFMRYQLNQGKYDVPQPRINGFFRRLFNLLKKLLGREPLNIKELYEKIQAGEFASVTPRAYKGKSADMRLSGVPVDARIKQELIAFVSQQIVQEVKDQGLLFELAEGNVEMGVAFNDAVNELINRVDRQDIKINGVPLSILIFEDTMEELEDGSYIPRVDSELLAAFKDYLRLYDVGLDSNVVQESSDDIETPSVENEEDLDSVDNENAAVGDEAFMKISFEFDPRNAIKSAMRLFLGTIVDTHEDGTPKTSPQTKLPKTIEYGRATNVLFSILNGVPNDLNIVVQTLEAHYERYPWLFQVVDALGETRMEVDEQTSQFRQSFLSSFVRNQYSFIKGVLVDGEVKMINMGNESQTTKYIRLWQNRIEIQHGSDAELLQALTTEKDLDAVAKLLGLDELVEQGLGEEEVQPGKTAYQMLADIKAIVAKSLRAGTPRFKLFDKNSDSSIEIEGSMRKIADMVAQRGAPFDLMLINAERKRIYAVSLHSFQTMTIGTLNWIANQKLEGTVEQQREQRLEMIKQWAPTLLDANNFVNGRVTSFYLDNILNGVPMRLEVFDGMGVSGIDTSFHKTGITDQLVFAVNSVSRGRLFALKHGDRSTLFSYRLANGALPVSGQRTDAEIRARAKDVLMDYILGELNQMAIARTGQNAHTGKGIIHLSSKIENQTIFDFLPKKDVDKMVKKMMEGKTPSYKELEKAFGSSVEDFILTMSRDLEKSLSEWGIYGRNDAAVAPVGIDKETWQSFMADNKSNPGDARKSFAAQVAVNYMFGYLEQMKLFTGSPNQYKNPVDFFKRIQMQSSTGKGMRNDAQINEEIIAANTRDSFELRDPLTGKVQQVTYGQGANNVKRIGYFSEVVLQSENFTSRGVVEKTHEGIDGEMVNPIEFAVQQGTYNLLIASGLSVEAATRRAIEKGKQATKSLESFDENDGASWLNMFAWREYKMRNGEWNRKLENTFQIELAVLSAGNTNIAETTVYLSPDGYNISAKAQQDWIPIRILDAKNIQEVTGTSLKSFYQKHLDYATMLKPQYTGPVSPDATTPDPGKFVRVIGGRKTAYGVLIPSAIRGTKLEALQAMQLRTGLDVAHMDTAAKYGHKEFGAFAPVEATRLYDDRGQINTEIEVYLPQTVSYLDSVYMKDQLSVSSQPKSKIRNSSQSTKTLLENIMYQGVPVDVAPELRETFEGMDNDAKRQMSPLWAMYDDYRSALWNLVRKAGEQVREEVGETAEKLVAILKDAAESRKEPLYILDSIAQFSEEAGLETLPNWSRLENILYSVVSNKAISIKRPGDGKPIYSSTFWESINELRENAGDKKMTSKALRYFTPVIENGKVVKVLPAEIILPLQPDMINELLMKSGQTNLQQALEWYEALPEEEKMMVKGLRIPNQQASYNGAFVVKKFTLPFMQSFAVFPAELVSQMGLDYDIDKEQLYYPARDKQGNVLTRENDMQRRLDRYREKQLVEFEGDAVTIKSLKKILRSEAKLLRDLRKQLKDDKVLEDSKSAFYTNFADTFDQIRSLYAISGATVDQLLGDVNEQMTSLEEDNETRRAELSDAVDNILAIVDNASEQVTETLDKIYGALDNLIGVEEGIEMESPGQPSFGVLHNELLNAELDLLLHPALAHRTFATNDDSLISKRLFDELVAIRHGVKPSDVAKNRDAYIFGELSARSLLSVANNTERSLTMLESKLNVGLVATGITGHNTATVDQLRLTPSHTVKEGENLINVSHVFPVAEHSDTLDLGTLTDPNGTEILEVLSILLTSQVDGVKNPYAPVLGLTSETLPAVVLMVRRGVPLRVALMFTLNPAVQHYLQRKAINDSGAWKSRRGANKIRLSAGKFNEAMAKDFRIQKDQFTVLENQFSEGSATPLTVAELEANLGVTSFNQQSARVVAAFLTIMNQAQDYFNVSRDMTADTVGLKSRAEIAEMESNKSKITYDIRMLEGGAPHREGFLQPFYQNRELYDQLFSKYYMLPYNNELVIEFLEGVLLNGVLRKDQRVRIASKFFEDMVVFAVQNSMFNNVSLEQLLTGPNSVAKRVQRMQDNPNVMNYALDKLLPIVGAGTTATGQVMDNLRIEERGLNAIATNDMYEAFKDLPVDLQQDLIKVSMFQSGVSTSRFTLREMLDVDQVGPILKQAIQWLNTHPDLSATLDAYTRLFVLNNPDFLPRSQFVAKLRKTPYWASVNEDTQQYEVRTKDGVVVALGSKNPARMVYNFGMMAQASKLAGTDVTAKVVAPVEGETINVYWGQVESTTSTKLLSNLALRRFVWEGREYGSVEHAYQSNKSGSFDAATYEAYNKIGGYGKKIRGKGTVTELQAADSLSLMRNLVVESFKQNADSDAARKLLLYSDYTHNTNELIDQAFLDGLRQARQVLSMSQSEEDHTSKENACAKLK